MLSKNFALILIFILGACGKQVNISNQKLKSYSELNKSALMTNEGRLIRGDNDKIRFDNVNYTVSRLSSHLSLQFIKTIPIGKEIDVKFKGEFKQNEIVLEQLENK